MGEVVFLPDYEIREAKIWQGLPNLQKLLYGISEGELCYILIGFQNARAQLR